MRKLVIAALLGGSIGTAHAAEEIVFGISAATGSLQHATAVEFTERANAKLGDGYQVVLYADGQIGDDKELMQKLKIGSVHLALPSSIMSSVNDLYGVFDLPFLIEDREHLARVEEAVFWPTLVPAAEAQGYKILGLWENGVRHITNSKRPINQPADLQGLKIRVPQGVWRVRMFEQWGANPTPMAFSEVFVAMQTGVIDGQENPLTNIAAAKFNEVQRYLSLTGHVYSPAFPAAGVNAFARLPEEVQEILAETAREVTAFARERGAAEDEELAQQLEAGGMEVNTADRAAFVESSQPIYGQFGQEVEGGAELVETVLGLAHAG